MIIEAICRFDAHKTSHVNIILVILILVNINTIRTKIMSYSKLGISCIKHVTLYLKMILQRKGIVRQIRGGGVGMVPTLFLNSIQYSHTCP